MENKKSLKGMQKQEMKSLCEDLKTIGKKYNVTDTEKIVLNNIMFCMQIGWEQINSVKKSFIQL